MANSGEKNGRPLRPETRLLRAGRDKSIAGSFVNPPVVHASTVLFESVDDMHHLRQRYEYGRLGTPTSDALEEAVAELEGADGVTLCPSGLSAVATALLSCLSAGDQILIVDSVYGPVRRLADTVLKRLGVEMIYYDPLIGGGIESLFTERTRAVYLESPGSLTFEMQDVAAIAAVAHHHGATVLCDNTWATPLYFRALDHGVDLSIISGTKYLGGHSDVMLGTVAARGAAWTRLRQTTVALGTHVAPDDVYLGLRGMRTLAVRLPRHWQSAMIVATWLAGRPEVERVLYPPLANDPGHALWKRDMTGASGLFSVAFKGWTHERAARFVDGLELFGIGASWGGFESLATLPHPIRTASALTWQRPVRTATAPPIEGTLVRLHIGLEDPADLLADIDASLTRVAALP